MVALESLEPRADGLLADPAGGGELLRASLGIGVDDLLLALAERPWTPAGEALRGLGLEPERIREALAQDARAALRAVGVEVPEEAFAARPAARGAVTWGESGKRALERSLDDV